MSVFHKMPRRNGLIYQVAGFVEQNRKNIHASKEQFATSLANQRAGKVLIIDLLLNNILCSYLFLGRIISILFYFIWLVEVEH